MSDRIIVSHVESLAYKEMALYTQGRPLRDTGEDSHHARAASILWPRWRSPIRRNDRRISTRCAQDTGLRQRIEELLSAQEKMGNFLTAAVGLMQKTIVTDPLEERPGSVIGPYRLVESHRRGRHGCRLPGRAGAAHSPAGGAQDHQAGHGQRAGHRPLRGGAAGPDDDGARQHRPRLRGRRHRRRAGRISSWSWSRACR